MDTATALWTRFVDLPSDRRAALKTIVGAGVVSTWRPAGAFAQAATPPALARFAGETFVGETSDPETLVAIVLGEETSAEPRPARGYLCNGLARTIDLWLTGEATGDQLTLTAEDGSQLSGILTPAGVGGGATLGDGTSLLFTALPATGLAGLYTVETLPEGGMAGGSASGATLVGALAAEDTVTDEGTDGERFVYDVVVTTSEGEPAPMTITTATTEEAESRLILLADGHGRGQGKTRKSRNWIDPEPTPAT